MRIAFFTARLIYGGGEKVNNWLAQKCVEAGFEIVHFTPRYDDVYRRNLALVGLDNLVEVVEYPHSIKKRHPIRFTMEMIRLYKIARIDAILMFGGSFLEEWAAKKLGIKVILAERCNPKWRKLPSRILKLLQYKLGDCFVFQTPEQAKCYSKYAQNHCIIVPNPIIGNLPLPTVPLRKEIVTVGRLSGEKNPVGVIDAFGKFHDNHKDYKLIMYGSGPLESQLRKKIDQLSLAAHVEIIQGKANIPELIEGASLFVSNSVNEGIPNALIEAMSMGIACISTDCPIYGPRILIRNGENGILIPVGDTEALYQRMCEVVDNQSLMDKLRTNSVKIRETLDENKIFSKWCELLMNLELPNCV